MIATDNQIFRITYEAFSKFSNSLSQCRTLDDVAACFKINLKYLFNFHIFRASYQRGNQYIHLTITSAGSTVQAQASSDYLDFEIPLLQKGIPWHCTETEILNLPAIYRLAAEEKPELWAWNFKQSIDRQVIISVLAGKSQVFTKQDISFLKMVAEHLESKLLEICLFRELDGKNKELADALTTIHDKNEVISSIVEQQKEVISLRTQEIANKNARLLEISVLNAHNVREPLSRILGLISLVDYYPDPKGIKEEIIPKLRISATDLDLALQDVITKATNDLVELKA